jgi:hypothetical protein
VPGAEFCRRFSGSAGEKDIRSLARPAAHFDLSPSHSTIHAGTKGFHGSFFGGKAAGKTLNTVALRFTVADLVFGKNPRQKTLAKAFNGRLDAVYFDDVNACAYNHQRSSFCRAL